MARDMIEAEAPTGDDFAPVRDIDDLFDNDGTDIMTRRRHTFAEIADVVEGWFR